MADTVDIIYRFQDSEYVGQGLRQDLSRLFADRVMEKIARVLSRHLQSEEEVSAILKEIRVETAQ